MTASRDDLAHLSPEALTQLTNAGIVKRAVRELTAGYRPRLDLDAMGTLDAHFDDGVHCTWPRGAAIANVRCSCGASGVCRHRVIAALAWREGGSGPAADHAAGAPAAVPSSTTPSSATSGAATSASATAPTSAVAGSASTPASASTSAPPAGAAPPDIASVSDDDIARLVPAAFVQAAQRHRDEGVSIDLRTRASGEPCDTARLPSATVRYWAGGAIEAARCDCVAANLCEHVVLGVWAFRAARERGAVAVSGAGAAGAATDPAPVIAAATPHRSPITTVRLGPPGARYAIDRQAFRACVAALLAHGVQQGGGTLAQGFTAARAAAADAAWLALLVADLEAWAEGYAKRSAWYDAADGVDLVAELALRLAAGPLPGHAGAVLGVGQTGESALDRLRLMSLGARTRRDGDQRITTLVLADIDTGTRMALRHHWAVPEAHEADEARLRAAERMAPGVLLGAIAHGQLLSQQASRRADGSVRLARARSSYNSVLPQAGDWSTLGAPLRFTRVAQLHAEALAHPHAAMQPRHAARRHVIFSPASVEAVHYDANDQSLFAVLADADGAPLLLHRTYERHAPHALDAIAVALGGRAGGDGGDGGVAALRHVAGVLAWRHGLPTIEPWALVGERMVVPDFATTSTGALAAVPLGRAPAAADDPTARLLERLRSHLATLLHHGARRLPPRWKGETRALAQALEAAGLRALGQHLAELQQALSLDEAATAAPFAAGSDCVAEAMLRLAALRQLHREAADAQRIEASRHAHEAARGRAAEEADDSGADETASATAADADE